MAWIRFSNPCHNDYPQVYHLVTCEQAWYKIRTSTGKIPFKSLKRKVWLPGIGSNHELDLVTHLPASGVEEMSYIPEIAYRYGRDERTYTILLALMDPRLKRREYPEVS